MNLLIFLAVLFLLLWILTKIYPGAFRRLRVRSMEDAALAQVGARALARQPDRITLQPLTTSFSGAGELLHASLVGEGLQPAGSYEVPEFPGLKLALLVRPETASAGAVYEHPVAGVWVDLFSRGEAEGSFTVSSGTRGGDLDPRPGHPVVRMPGASVVDLLTVFLAQRPEGAWRMIRTSEAPQVFADAFAEGVAYRKRQGLHAEEVRRVGLRKDDR